MEITYHFIIISSSAGIASSGVSIHPAEIGPKTIHLLRLKKIELSF